MEFYQVQTAVDKKGARTPFELVAEEQTPPWNKSQLTGRSQGRWGEKEEVEGFLTCSGDKLLILLMYVLFPIIIQFFSVSLNALVHTPGSKRIEG